MSDTFEARYIGCGCFIRRNVADGRSELVFVNQANRDEYGFDLILGKRYKLWEEFVEIGKNRKTIFHVEGAK